MKDSNLNRYIGRIDPDDLDADFLDDDDNGDQLDRPMVKKHKAKKFKDYDNFTDDDDPQAG